jgi:cysteine desulfurase / selenocysteine lyase
MSLAATPTRAFNVHALRRDFPILAELAHGRPLVYLDNAATTQKPKAVIDRLVHYYLHENANVHRGVHLLSERATEAFEAARRTAGRFLHAADPREIVFVRGTTEAINLVAQTYGRAHVGAGDEVLITEMEHHSNIVPWQMLCQQTGATLRVVPMTDEGELLLHDFERLLSDRTKIVSLVHVSNALGTINPVRQIAQLAHQRGIVVVVDGAQAVAHMPVDVQDLDCDFYAFSGHKVCGPTGIGILYGKAALLEKMQPFKGGGDMILSVTFEKTTYNTIPHKFEAGTPPIAGAIGLGAAIDYLSGIGLDAIAGHETDLLDYATRQVNRLGGVRIIGTAERKAAVLSFAVEGVHPHDVGTLLNEEGVAIRTGHHCAQPVMQRFKVPATCRASFAFYNTLSEVDALVAAIRKVQKVFG